MSGGGPRVYVGRTSPGTWYWSNNSVQSCACHVLLYRVKCRAVHAVGCRRTSTLKPRSQHMNWTELDWPELTWASRLQSPCVRASRPTSLQRCYCNEVGHLVLNTCIPMGLFTAKFANSMQFVQCEYSHWDVVCTQVLFNLSSSV